MPFRFNRIEAPIAINAGGLSPIGEPFAIFPPKVAAFLTCIEPYLLSNSEKSGYFFCNSCLSTSMVVLAPTFKTFLDILIFDISSICPIKHISFKSRKFFVTHKPTSVAPPTKVPFGFLVHHFSNSLIVLGR